MDACSSYLAAFYWEHVNLLFMSISGRCEREWCLGLLDIALDRLTHVVEHICPSLHGDALEDGEDGEQDVVKLGDAVVGSKPATSTHRAVKTQPGRQLCATW